MYRNPINQSLTFGICTYTWVFLTPILLLLCKAFVALCPLLSYISSPEVGSISISSWFHNRHSPIIINSNQLPLKLWKTLKVFSLLKYKKSWNCPVQISL
uniref:Uncharacterized protein n=1 Tax=Engystomops pustulosus TaxID=76066 RepID=A0AAV6YQ92_ENGPU|nr:hypothetical protein GDO81_026919 [Engystomops pustulosus]